MKTSHSGSEGSQPLLLLRTHLEWTGHAMMGCLVDSGLPCSMLHLLPEAGIFSPITGYKSVWVWWRERRTLRKPSYHRVCSGIKVRMKKERMDSLGCGLGAGWLFCCCTTGKVDSAQTWDKSCLWKFILAVMASTK